MVTIGNLIFGTPDSHGRLGQTVAPVSPNIYWTYAAETVNLTSLAATAGATKQLSVKGNQAYVTVKNVILTAYFSDGATAIYNVSNKCLWTPIGVANGDLSTFSFNSFQTYQPLDLVMNVNASRQIEITVAINGGDVLRETGINPGAGDSVSFTLNVSYY